MKIKSILKRIITSIAEKVTIEIIEKDRQTELLALGKLLSNQQYSIKSRNINDYEFKIYSQWGDDGIIQYLIKNLVIKNKYFIEFGVDDFSESNCRFLMMNSNWSGFVMDGSTDRIEKLKSKSWFWMYNLTAKSKFVTKENIDDILLSIKEKDIGLLHIDIDGNDYFVFKEMNLDFLNPSIIILEYNSLFGPDRAITIPYRSDFNRTKAHHSNLFFGASLRALNYAAESKGYSLIGTTIAGNNAYFIRKDLLNQKIKSMDTNTAYHYSKFRESRDPQGSFSLVSGDDRFKKIKGLQVENILTGQMESL
jgi:hypothetical protein